MSPPPPASRPDRVHPAIALLSQYCWRLIVIGIVALSLLWLVSRLRLVLIPIVVALFVTRGLAPVSGWLRRHGWAPTLAVIGALLAAVILVAAIGAAVVPALANEFDSIGPTVTEALDDVEDWLVEDSPYDVSRASIDRLRERTGDRVDQFLSDSDGAVLDQATLFAEVVTGLILSTFLTFFMLRDGARFTDWAVRLAPERRRRTARAVADRAWSTLGGYLRGVALLGLVEAIAIGLALFVGGAGLIAPVMILTFVAAFVPIVGAIVAGAIAVLVALATGGVVSALIVAVVAIVVQQLDNDLLAPVIYGRALALHPVVILLSIVAGGALFGIAGTMLAVPTVAIAVNVGREVRSVESRDPASSG